MEYYVLKGHDTSGPFSEEDLRRAFAGRRLEETDLVRPSDERHWTPLRKLLDRLDSVEVPAPVPRNSNVVGVAGWVPVQRAPGLWDLINVRPMRAGIAGVVLAGLLAFLARWPFLVALPGLVLGVIAGLILIMRHRPLAGGMISLLAIILPLALAPNANTPASSPPGIATSAPVTSAPPEVPKAQPAIAHEVKPALEVPAEPAKPIVEEPVEAPRGTSPAASIAAVSPDPPPIVEKPARVSEAAPAAEPPKSESGFFATLMEKLKPAPKPPQEALPPLPEPGGVAAATTPPGSLPPLPAVVPSPGISSPTRPEDFVFLVDTGTGRGTGFLAADQGRTYFFTNLHVVSGAKKISARSTLTTFDFKEGSIEVAADRDLVRIPVPAQPGLQFAGTPQVEDGVVALGNSGGREVVTRLEGKVMGVGPAQIEVSSEFIPGNSGGPLLDKNNRVLGVATYVLRGESVPDWIKAGTRFSTTRRFGVRVTDDVKWEPIPIGTLLRQTALQQTGEEIFTQYIGVVKAIWERPFSQPLATQLSERPDMRFFIEDYNRSCRDLGNRPRNNLNRADYYARLRTSLGKLGRCIRSTGDALRRDLGSASKGYMKEREKELLEAYDKLATAIEKDERDLFHL